MRRACRVAAIDRGQWRFHAQDSSRAAVHSTGVNITAAQPGYRSLAGSGVLLSRA